MPFQTSSPSFRLFGLVLIISLMIGIFISCQTTSGSRAGNDDGFGTDDAEAVLYVPPPRSASALRKYPDTYGSDSQCSDAPLRLDDIKRHVAGVCHGRATCEAYHMMRQAEELMDVGLYSEAIDLCWEALGINDNQGGRSLYYFEMVIHPLLAQSYASIGEFAKARMYAGSGNPGQLSKKRDIVQVRISATYGKATVAQKAGDYQKAERLYRKALKQCRKYVQETPDPRWVLNQEAKIVPDLAENLIEQGRFAEAEFLIRETLDDPYGRKNASSIGRLLTMLGKAYLAQGRFEDSAILSRGGVNVYTSTGANCASIRLNEARTILARANAAIGDYDAAIEQYEAIARNMLSRPEMFGNLFKYDPDWIVALLASGRLVDAKNKIQPAKKKLRARYGAGHYNTLEMASLDGVLHYLSDNPEEALERFQSSVPDMLQTVNLATDNVHKHISRNKRLGFILESYMALLGDVQSDTGRPTNGFDPAEDAFQVAETIRNRSVQQSVAASSARAAAGDKKLASLVRDAQNAALEIEALNTAQTNAISQKNPDTELIAKLKSRILGLKESRDKLLERIDREFPEYAELTNPQLPDVDLARVMLRPDELLISFYIGQKESFVWAVPKTGRVEFHSIPIGANKTALLVDAVQNGLRPEALTLEALERFDVASANQVYRAFFQPVQKAMDKANHLLVVPHGHLGLVSFGMLPTSPRITSKTIVPLAKYRSVDWLIRSHRITVLPSVSSLAALRKMPGAEASGQTFAGFGDPWFTKAQASAAGMQAADTAFRGTLHTRAIRLTEKTTLDDIDLTSATLSSLQPLPDTREEVLAIASALNADSSKDVFLGKDASEMRLKKTDLSDRRVLVFATHGLVPGDLDGLNQPALALSAPELVGDNGNDGLLTMGEIFGLKLDADWVVLSACNTAAGEGKGAEAVSGLGRAFFYAGARSLLVSNWPVETRSAKMLTTDIFKRQAANPDMSRAEALRQSMLNLLDRGEYLDPATGKPVFAYAHPLFWAPFTLVGEGAGTR